MEGHLRIPNKLVKDQFFERLKGLTEAYSLDLSAFFRRSEASSLQKVLRAFSQKYFTIFDEGTEPSLKARLVALLTTYPSSKYRQHSEVEFSNGKYRVDILMESLDSQVKHRVFECKSIPLHWIDPSEFDEDDLNDFYAQQEVAPIVAKMETDQLLRLRLNSRIQKNWKTKYTTVGEYIEAGQKQMATYLDNIEQEKGERPVGYLVWAVGVVAIHVEQFP